jgi:hypothetical protein
MLSGCRTARENDFADRAREGASHAGLAIASDV